MEDGMLTWGFRYVATTKGIVEYKIDLAQRKVFPSIQLR